MNNRKKLWAKVGLSLLVVGAILFGAGFAMGGVDAFKATVEVRTGTYGADEITAVRIQATSADVRLETTDGDAVEATWFEGEREGVEVTVENGVLVLRQYDERKWRDYIGISFDDGREIIVRVPGGLAGAELFSTSGDVQLKDVPIAGEAILRSTSGNLEATGSAGSLVLATTSGDIGAKDAKVAGDAKAGSTSGRIAISGLSAGGAFEATTTSGDISVSDAAAQSFTLGSVSGDVRLSGADAGSGAISATTTSGKIRLSDVSAAAYSFGAVSGDVTGVLPGKKSDYTIASRTVSGKNSLPTESFGGQKTIEAVTTSGDIELSFEE
jgi:DUF4097 and DUF4098 domain-containing protein YvlB